MNWKVLRREFVDGIVPCRLGMKAHKIKSGVAYVIENELGELAFCGPTCRGNGEYVTNPKEKVPDLTTTLSDNNGNSIYAIKNESQSSKEVRLHQNCLLYLELLVVLNPVINIGVDTDCEYLNIIIRLIDAGNSRTSIAKSSMYILLDMVDEVEGSKYSLRYLKLIYTYIKQIDYLLNEVGCTESNQEFLLSCKQYVVNHGYISEKQFLKVNQKLKKINRRIRFIRMVT